MNDRDLGACPLCSGSEAKVAFSTGTPFMEFQIVQCSVCELARTFPRPAGDSLRVHDFSGYYGKGVNKFIPIVQKIRNILMRSRAKRFLSFIPDSVGTPKVLDVGCAEGRLLKSFVGSGCQCWGIEHPSYPSRRFLGRDRIVYLKGDFKTLGLPEGAYDLIFLWHVLEHMDDPDFIMRRLHDLLAPGGVLILAVPNFSSLEAMRFKQSWFHLDIPWHKYHFNERSIGYLIAKNHLRIIRMSTLCLEQGPYGLFQSILNAMAWPKNELYEALKGSVRHGRGIYLTAQVLIVMLLLIPGSFVSLLTSTRGRGPVLRLIVKKGE